MGEEADQYTQHVITTLGRECREWAPGATNAQIDSIISEKMVLSNAVEGRVGLPRSDLMDRQWQRRRQQYK